MSGLLSDSQKRQVLYGLSILEPKLCKQFDRAFDHAENIFILVTTEMDSIRKDIVYWERLAESPQWVIYIRNLHSKAYNFIFKFQLDYVAFKNDTYDRSLDFVEKQLNVLSSNFNELASILALVNESLECLKYVYLEVVTSLQQFNGSNIIKSTNEHNSIIFIRDKILKCLKKLLKATSSESKDDKDLGSPRLSSPMKPSNNAGNNLIPQSPRKRLNHRRESTSYFPNIVSLNSNNDDFKINGDIIFDELDQIGNEIETIIHNFELFEDANEKYPIGRANKSSRSPTNFERYWLINFISGAIIGTLSIKLINMYRDGSLADLLLSTTHRISYGFREHVSDPFKELFNKISDTIGPRGDMIVTEQDLKQSKEALGRMLDDFSKTKQGLDLINHHLVKIKNDISSSVSGVKGTVQTLLSDAKETVQETTVVAAKETTNIITDTITDTIKDIVVNSNNNKLRNGSLSDEQQLAWDALMRSYESDMKSPFVGLTVGNLANSMLIQIQKLKVHTEAAMLTMDQVLASNQLTMAATAAMPGFAMMGIGTYITVKFFRPSIAKAGPNTLPLRLILSDVERSLADVYSAEIISLQNKSDNNDILPSLVVNNRILVARGKYCFHIRRLRNKLKKFFSTKEIAVFGASEYISISRDICELVSPDFEVSMDRKRETAKRMRISYQCFVPPR